MKKFFPYAIVGIVLIILGVVVYIFYPSFLFRMTLRNIPLREGRLVVRSSIEPCKRRSVQCHREAIYLEPQHILLTPEVLEGVLTIKKYSHALGENIVRIAEYNYEWDRGNGDILTTEQVIKKLKTDSRVKGIQLSSIVAKLNAETLDNDLFFVDKERGCTPGILTQYAFNRKTGSMKITDMSDYFYYPNQIGTLCD